MRTATGWAVVGVLGACALAAPGMDEIVALPPPVAPAAAAVADAPPDPATAALIADLGSPDYRAREKAGAALAAKGEKALPDLRRALAAADNPEVSRRLTVLVRRMDHDRLVSPKRVTFAVKNKPAKDVFDEIAKQTGYKIDFQGGGNADCRYSFDFANAPFWVAVDQVAEATGMSVYANGGDDDVVQINSYSDAHNPHVTYAGPFRLVATGINANKSVQLSGLNRKGFGPRPQENINLNFQIQSEPKNPILGTLPAELTAATDETGASLVPPKDGNNNSSRSYYNGGQRGHNAYGNVNLVRAGKDATTIKTLKGKIGIVLLAFASPEIVIADPLKAKTRKLVGRSVELDYDAMTEANGQYTATLTVKKLGVEDPNNMDYNWSNNLWQKIEVTDAKGNRYRSYGPNNLNNNGNAVQMTIPFGPDNRRGQPQKLGPPVKLVFNEWHQVTHEVTFEFKDIPLP